MKDLLKEVALEVADKLEQRGRTYSPDHYVEFATAFQAELSNRAEAVAWMNPMNNVVMDNQRKTLHPDRYSNFSVPLFTFPPIHDIEIVGLKELLEEVQKADDALSAGDSNEALIKVRTSWVAASVVKQQIRNRKLFKVLDVEAIENQTAEACAKMCDALAGKEKAHATEYGPGYLNYTAQDISDLLNSGEWRKYK